MPRGPGSGTKSLPAHLFALPKQVSLADAVQQPGQMPVLAEPYRRQDALPSTVKLLFARCWVDRYVRTTASRRERSWVSPLLVAWVTVDGDVQRGRYRRVGTWWWLEDPETRSRSISSLLRTCRQWRHHGGVGLSILLLWLGERIDLGRNAFMRVKILAALEGHAGQLPWRPDHAVLARSALPPNMSTAG